MTRVHATALAGLGILLGVSGCGGPAATSALGSSVDNVPSVAKPIDPGPYLTNPCSLLTSAQLATLGIQVAQPPSPETDSTGPQCSWRDQSTYDHLGLIWLTHSTGGLADLYRQRGSQAYFQPTTVQGYPAVFAATKDERSIGACTIVNLRAACVPTPDHAER